LHKGVNGWLPQAGAQYAELDADWFGPSNPLNNEPASVKISQEIATIPGYEYKIEYHFSPRPGTSEADNKLVSAWDGVTLDTHTGAGAGNTTWTKYTKTAEATSEKAVVSFMDDGTPNSLGTFIDNVSVECVRPVPTDSPTPTPMATLFVKKYECSEGSVLNKTSFTTGEIDLNENQIRPDSSGLVNGMAFDQLDDESFAGCVEGESYTFEVDQHPDDTAGGGSPTGPVFPLDDVITDANGDGVLSDIEYEGRLEVRELKDDPSRILGFACYRNGEGHGDISNYGEYALFNEDKEAYCVAFNKPVQRFADVTVCKQDNQQNYLPGWNVQLLGELLETVEVEPDDKIGDPYTPSYSSELPEGDYVLMARGTYKYRGGTELLTDPAYSERLESDGFVGPYIPWINVMDLTTTGALGVTVNDDPADWGYFSPANTYARGFENYTGEFKFTSFDNNITDNEGSMYVDIYEGYAGFTEQNGCVTFEDVPYGDYMRNEILMKDWENVSGQASEVVVENETETFTLVNRPVSEPAKLLATKVVCSEEQYLPNNQQGPIDADTAAEWVAQSGGQCKIEEDWDFQWGPAESGSFGDFQENTTEMGEPWTTFSSGVEVELPELESVGGRVELREVFPDESYVPFSNDGNVSAEFYCTGDTTNYDNWEWLSGYQEDNTYYCVAFNAVKMGAIEGMKFEDANANGERDDEEMGIPNWQIVLKPETLEPIYDLDLPANSPTGVNTGVLSSSKYYLVEVEGTYSYSGVTKLADAEYYSTDNWSNSADFADNPGRDVRTLDVVIDNQNIEWGSSNSAHLYKTVIKGNDAVANLRIFDEDNDPNPPSWYNDNAGTLEVRVYDVSNYRVETDEDGEYSQEIENGEYQVVEINQPGWIQTAPSPSYCHLTVENGSIETCEFGNTRMGLIDGYKLEDTNGDGTLTRQDARLEGWEINLWTGDEEGPISKIQTKTTDENGYYKFDNLLPGIYWLNENQKDGWTQTAGDEVQGPLVIQVGTELHGNNFGNFELGRVQGYKWDDMNANGLADEDKDSLLSGWKVTLEILEDDEENGYKVMNSLSYKMTDEKGAFEFDGLLPGEYKLCEEMQDGWMQTYPSKQNEISVAFSDDYDTECHYIEIETSGQVLSNFNFGNFELGQVSGYKWDDDNGDGIKTYGEPKMEGWTVELRMD
ncbi:MAG TPA: SdrD B-like domain-containing protein, partial [Candidatus Dojkabacteria bacterium]|nr:SdrD B-like domain-containing protein [Candidatus Dojkabacteria bacterium]